MSAHQNVLADDSEDVPLVVRRRLPEGELDITPMIDVTFLLLIFFMVASNMQGNKRLDLPEARHGVGVESGGATKIEVLMERGASSPKIRLEDGSTTDIAGVRQHVEQRVRDGRRQVIIKAERRVPHGYVQQVTRAVNEVEGVQFFIGVDDK
jgi:biopolymer transport protein TolR